MKFKTEFLENSEIQLIDGDRGKNYPKQADFNQQGDCLFLSAKNVTLSGFKFSETSFINKEKDGILRAGKLQRGDIVVTTRGTIGNIAFYSDDVPYDHVRINSGMMIFRADKYRWNRRFLYFLLKSNFVKQQIESLTSGSAVPQLPARDLKKFELPNIPKVIQDSIEKIIGDLSDKTELNQQTNQTLEQIAQAIFKSWFVDFEPVKAKAQIRASVAQGKMPNSDQLLPKDFDIEAAVELAAMCAISGKTEEQLKGLNGTALQQLKTTAALFPDALFESELGEIPEGWSVKTIEKLSTIVAMGPFGSNIKVETFVDEGIPIINGQQLKGTMLGDGDNKFITYEHADELIKSNVYRGDIVITHRGTLGQVSIIPEGSKYKRYIVSQSQCYIRPDREVISPLFMIYYFKSYIGQHELLAHKSQVGVPSIAKPVTNLRKIELVSPSKVVSELFQDTVNVLHRKISKNLDEIGSLQEIRDVLLPRFLSGDLINNDTQTKAEAVA